MKYNHWMFILAFLALLLFPATILIYIVCAAIPWTSYTLLLGFYVVLAGAISWALYTWLHAFKFEKELEYRKAQSQASPIEEASRAARYLIELQKQMETLPEEKKNALSSEAQVFLDRSWKQLSPDGIQSTNK